MNSDTSVYNFNGFACTGTHIDSTFTLPASELYAPLTPGDCEARRMLDDGYQIMVLAPFTVK